MGCAASKGGGYRADTDFSPIERTDHHVVRSTELASRNVRNEKINGKRNDKFHFDDSMLSHRGLVGLKNLGNTCFLNASIQCLSNTAPLVDFFLKKNWQREINRMNPLGKSGEVAECFGDLIRQMWVGNSILPVISPDRFKRILGIHQPQFSGYEQHDAQELLAFLLDGLHEDLNRVKSKPYVEDIESDGSKDDADVAALSWSGYLRRNRSVIVDLSQGQLRSTLRCLTCDTKSVKFDAFMFLSLPIVKRKSKVVSLRSCIREFCRAELLTGDCRWKCPKCKELRDAEKRLSLWSLPPILIIHLKRFEHDKRGNRSKIEDLVDFPLNHLDLGPLIPDNTQKEVAVYDLYGVSNHLGGLMGGGHYTAIAKNRINKNWYLFNDSNVRAVDDSIICSKAAYVLFYQKQQPSEAVTKQTLSTDSSSSSSSDCKLPAKDGKGSQKEKEGKDGKFPQKE